MATNPIRGNVSGFNPYAAGKKQYGSGRPMPNIGKSGSTAGYGRRDAEAKARKDALIRRAGSM
jgi:hypothetical protein